MRKALGLDPIKPKKTPKPKLPTLYTLVELSVRKDGGLPFRFTHRSNSMFRFVAQQEAEKAARKKGYEVWVLLDIRQVSE